MPPEIQGLTTEEIDKILERLSKATPKDLSIVFSALATHLRAPVLSKHDPNTLIRCQWGGRHPIGKPCYCWHKGKKPTISELKSLKLQTS